MNLYQISQPKFNFKNIDDGFILLLIDCARMGFFHSLFKLFNTPTEASACYFHFVFFCQVGRVWRLAEPKQSNPQCLLLLSISA